MQLNYVKVRHKSVVSSLECEKCEEAFLLTKMLIFRFPLSFRFLFLYFFLFFAHFFFGANKNILFYFRL